MTIDEAPLSGSHDDLSAFFWKEISSHHERTKDPLLLSNLGFALAKEKLRLPEGESLRTFLEKHLEDRVRVVPDPHRPTVFVVTLAENQAAVEKAISAERPFAALAPRPLLLAFCIKIREGERIFYRPVGPRYAVGEVAPDNTYVEVDSDLRLPGRRIEHIDSMNAELRVELEELSTSGPSDTRSSTMI